MLQTTIFPALRYQDAVSAIKWLCEKIGFEEHVVYASDGIVHHAQLKHGNGYIMVSSSRNNAYDEHIRIPKNIDNINTQSCYIFVDNLQQHYDEVSAKGVEIVLPLTKEDHGSGYTCRDPEGYLWSFGDYNPFAAENGGE